MKTRDKTLNIKIKDKKVDHNPIVDYNPQKNQTVRVSCNIKEPRHVCSLRRSFQPPPINLHRTKNGTLITNTAKYELEQKANISPYIDFKTRQKN